MIEKPINGSQHGCYDQETPTSHSQYQLSRILDVLYSAQQAGLNQEQITQIFSILPEEMKLEFNYSNWKYSNQ